MRRSRAASAVALLRPLNLVVAAAGVAVGGFLALSRVAFPPALLWAMGSALGLGAAGNAANDVFDVEADRISHPLRPLVLGELSRGTAIVIAGIAGGLGLFAAWWVGWSLFFLAVFALAVMLAYSPVFKSRGVLGNLAVAVVASLPLIYGAQAAGDWRAGGVPFLLAALLHLAREIVKDVEDVRGDLAIGRRTLPIVWGPEAGYLAASAVLLLFIPLALVPWAFGWYGHRYGLLVVLLDVGAVALILRLGQRRLEFARAALKFGMVVGLAALLWDRL